MARGKAKGKEGGVKVAGRKYLHPDGRWRDSRGRLTRKPTRPDGGFLVDRRGRIAPVKQRRYQAAELQGLPRPASRHDAARQVKRAVERATGAAWQMKVTQELEGARGARDVVITTRSRAEGKMLDGDAAARILREVGKLAGAAAERIKDAPRVQLVARLYVPETGETMYRSLAHAKPGAAALQQSGAVLEEKLRRYGKGTRIVGFDFRMLPERNTG